MDPAVHDLIVKLHATDLRFALVLTGGGASAAGWLLSVPGGSRTVLEVAVPYGEDALADYLGRRPASYCSAQTSHALASRACDRACWLAPGVPAAGVAVTASLRSDRPKRGDHRCHISLQTLRRAATLSLTLRKDARERIAEEDVVDRVLLNVLAEACGIADRVAVPLLPGEVIHAETTPPADPLTRFLAGELPTVCLEPDGRCRVDACRPPLLLAGSFNPMHEGHRRLAEVAGRRTGRAVAFELAVLNAEKGMLPDEEIRRRIGQFAWRAPLWLTRAATFPAKAELFPGTTFVVGADTAARIVQPRFYADCEERMAEALAAFRKHGCRFLVAGRADAKGCFLGLADLAIPVAFRDLFAEIPVAEFRFDVSSTRIRSAS